MDRHFDEELIRLKEMVSTMASSVQETISLSIKGLKERNLDILKKVYDNENKINRLQMEIDEMVLMILALRQPVATDLRFITSCMKINNDLERIGDEAVNIAERAEFLIANPPLKPLIDIPRMAEISQGMVKDAISSLLNKDGQLAQGVRERDDEVDDLRDQIFRELLTYMMEDQKNVKRAMELISIARYLERVGDHATNIAENVIYMVSGKDVRHPTMKL
ncbi:TPA: phosphate transport system regulatory protein PhoU [bacterium]|nr:phosphate transport system regulatory protein PhoU [bacterium]